MQLWTSSYTIALTSIGKVLSRVLHCRYNTHSTAILFFIHLSTLVSGLSAYQRFHVVGILNSVLYKYSKEMKDPPELENKELFLSFFKLYLEMVPVVLNMKENRSVSVKIN